MCICNDGFSGNGSTCQGMSITVVILQIINNYCFFPLDINECDLPNRCSENAECSNTPGSFQCTCTDSYFGDGLNSCTGLLKILSVIIIQV